MEPVSIIDLAETSTGWECKVEVGSGGDVTRHTVTLERGYWQRLTGGKTEPRHLVEKSFQFLLEREPKTSILRSFDLSVISRYFPEYETRIRELL